MIPCLECGTPFNTPEALAVHVKLHTGDASLMDDLCNITASLHNQNQSYSVNFNPSTHTSPKKRNHVCEHCSKSFSSKHGFQQHQKRHPEGTCSQRSFVCEVCKKAFFQRNHLQLHQRQHSINKEQSVCVTDMLSVKLDPEMESNSSGSGNAVVVKGEGVKGNNCDLSNM